MDKLIPVINQLQDVFNTVGGAGIDLPQIVVVGSQSSGKSSVLESLVGRDFLPRGNGIVTRRPLVLHLMNTPSTTPSESGSNKAVPNGNASSSSSSSKYNDPFANGSIRNNETEEWGEFLHKPREHFVGDFNKIRDEIQAETDRKAGTNKGVIADPITLTIYSPHVLNLTLVDLPGITRIPVGAQPNDIEAQIKKMILSYISKPNALILAVSEANNDLANSAALQLAMEVDPKGDRTLGVLTKLDIMDKGTNALEILQNKAYKLKLGFVGVVNRSQKDIIDSKSIAEARKAERDFFTSHGEYSVLKDKFGTEYLSKTLNTTLLNHIKDRLPELKVKINQAWEETTRELASYGEAPDKLTRSSLVLDMINKFSAGYKEAISGNAIKEESKVLRELLGGARIQWTFDDFYSKSLAAIDPLVGLSPKDIRFTIRNATGPRNALFIPDPAFELLAKKQISKMEPVVFHCLELVYSELKAIIAQLETPELSRFVALREKIMTEAESVLYKCLSPTKRMLQDLLEIEYAYINTAHPDFRHANDELTASKANNHDLERMLFGGNSAAPSSAKQQQSSSPSNQQVNASGLSSTPSKRTAKDTNSPVVVADRSTPASPAHPPVQNIPNSLAIMLANTPVLAGEMTAREQDEVHDFQVLLRAYFNIVRKTINDTIPKAIMNMLVNDSIKSMLNHLVLNVLNSPDLEALCGESPEIAARRQACAERLVVLEKARDILASVRDSMV